MKSVRNKTIDFSLEEGQKYLDGCVYPKAVEKILPNSTVCADTFVALKKID